MATRLSDTFTDSDGASLDAHTPDVRPGSEVWQELLGNWQITGNKACVSAGINHARAVIETGLKDCVVRASVMHNSTNPGAHLAAGVVVRYKDAGNFWAVVVNPQADQVRIEEWTNSQYYLRASTAMTVDAGTYYLIEVTLNGTSISATVDGANAVNYTSSMHYKRTKHGITLRNPDDRIDDFQVDGQLGVIPLNNPYIDGWNEDVETLIDALLTKTDAPNGNYGVHDAIRLSSTSYTGLARYNLAALAGRECSQADLKLTRRDNDFPGTSGTVRVYLMAAANEDYIEGTRDGTQALAGEPTWNGKAADGAGGVTTPWAGSAGLETAGTDYEATPLGSFTTGVNDPAGTVYTVSLDPARVEAKFGGMVNLVLKLYSGTGAGRVCAAEYPTTAYRPKLEITHAAPAGGGSVVAGRSLQMFYRRLKR